MTTSIQTPVSNPAQAVGQAATIVSAGARFRRRFFLGLLAVVAVFVGTYAFAWYNANQLASRFFNDAEASYKNGDFLKALVGYQQFNQQTNKYVNYGGYVSVEKIWSSRNSWPVPQYVQVSSQRSQEIIQQKLTADEALQYVQDNTGRPGAPYFGEIYLRLGELFEQQGDYPDAKDVYQSLPGLFPNRKDLIAVAQQHLASLQSQGK